MSVKQTIRNLVSALRDALAVAMPAKRQRRTRRTQTAETSVAPGRRADVADRTSGHRGAAPGCPSHERVAHEMRPRSVVYAYEPAGEGGLRALRRQLGARGAYAPPDILAPISALRELDSICVGMVSGRGGPNKANRPSLIKDVSLALKSLGPKTQKAAGRPFTDFQREIPNVSARLDTPQGARVTQLSVRLLLARLADDRIVGGAWQDTVDAFVDCDTRADDCELRLAQLANLAEHRGVDFDSWASLAEGILGDEPHALSDAGEDMDEAIQSGKNHGGVEERRRVELCELTLARLPTRSDVAVWLVINHATPADEYQEIGPVQLFAGVLWPDQVRAGRSSDGQKEWTPPVELLDWESAKPMFERLDADAERTFVRVFVEDTTPTLARQHARDGVQNLIDLANPNSGWTILEAAVSWRRERGWSGTPLRNPRPLRLDKRTSPPRGTSNIPAATLCGAG